jgi:plasmid stabilization system protein ParE
MKVEFFPAAEQELLEAAAEYEAHLPGLGNDFILEVERLSSVLVELPSLGEKLDPIHRRIPLRRFPYALIFRRNGDIIRVVAVAHRRRRPRYLKPRVQYR